MLPVAAVPEAASFTDDTSLPYAGCRVSIHAQVIREHPIHWYFFLKARVPDGSGEFKADGPNTFFSLAESERQQIFRTLRLVRIHITDPRAYTANVADVLRKILPKGTTVPGFLNRLDHSTQHLAHVRDRTIEVIAQRILHDAPAERLKRKYRAWEYANGLAFLPPPDAVRSGAVANAESERRFDFTPFQQRPTASLTNVANFVSASASVFSPAVDQLDEALDDPVFASPMAGPWLINKALSRSHAFDQGNSRAVKWIDRQRADVLADTDRHNHFYPAQLPEPLQELVSMDSTPIQAADIAASIAREVWHRNDLVHLVRQFEYVTYNGQRISENQAAEFQTLLDASLTPTRS